MHFSLSRSRPIEKPLSDRMLCFKVDQFIVEAHGDAFPFTNLFSFFFFFSNIVSRVSFHRMLELNESREYFRDFEGGNLIHRRVLAQECLVCISFRLFFRFFSRKSLLDDLTC